jgi:hypothetical protein
VPGREFDERFGDWIAEDHALTVAVEDALAGELGLEPASCSSTTRPRRRCSGLDLPVLRRGGHVARVTAAGLGGRDQPADAQRPALSLRAVAARVRGAARRGRVAVPRERILAALQQPADALRAAVTAGSPLL